MRLPILPFIIILCISLIGLWGCGSGDDRSAVDLSQYEYVHDALPVPFFPSCTEVQLLSPEAYPSQKIQYHLLHARHHMYPPGHQDSVVPHLVRAERIVNELPPTAQMSWLCRIYIDRATFHTSHKDFTLAEIYSELAIENATADQALLFESLLAKAYAQWAKYDSIDIRNSMRMLSDMLNENTFRTDLIDAYFKIVGNTINNLSFISNDEIEEFYEEMLLHCNGRQACLAKQVRLKGFWRYLKSDSTISDSARLRIARRNLLKSTSMQHKLDCNDLEALSNTYELLAMIPVGKSPLDSAILYSRKAVETTFGRSPTIEDYKSNILAIELLSSYGEAVIKKAMATGDIALGQVGYSTYDTVVTLISHWTKYPRDTYLQWNFFNNYYSTLLVAFCDFMYTQTEDQKWLAQMLSYIGGYKSEGLRRDKRLQRAWSVHEVQPKKEVLRIAEIDKTLEEFELAQHKGSVGDDHFKQKLMLVDQLNDAFGTARRDDPQLYDALIPQVSFNPLSTIDESKQDSVLRIYYYLGSQWYNDSLLYCLSLYRGELALNRILIDVNIFADTLDLLYDWHANGRASPPDIKEYQEISHHLYLRLIAPTLSSFDSKPQQVQILPDHLLSDVPFEAFVTHVDPLAEYYFQLHYLIRELPISYRYAVVSDDNVRTRHSIPATTALLSWTDLKTFDDLGDSDLEEMESFLSEIQGFENVFPTCKVLTGRKCTYRNLLKVGKNSDILHVLTHGEASSSSRLGSRLYMRSRSGTDTIYPNQLLYHNITPSLITLSACQSGSGLVRHEENAFSIGRAFYIAGAKQVLGCKWDLSESVAKVAFPEFYQSFATTNRGPIALQKAKLTIIDNHKSIGYPGFWAGLELHQ